ncbi:MAG: sigma 54-interacting transcriptional regulator, partial [Planctomycetota bacterium]
MSQATYELPADSQSALRELFADPARLGAEAEAGVVEAALDLAQGLTGCAQVGLRLASGAHGALEVPWPAPAGLPGEVGGAWLEPLALPLLPSGEGPTRVYGLLACAPAPDPEAAARAARHVSTLLVRDALERARDRDPATGLLSRPHFERGLDALSGALAAGEPRALLICDVDGLWRLNAERGFAAGDGLLRTLAAAADAGARARGGRAYRYGSDELALVLASDDARGLARELQAAVASVAPSLTLSQGFALGAGLDDARQLVRRADRALAAAKAEGRGRVVGWSEGLGQGAPPRLAGVLTGHAGRDLQNLERLFEALESVSGLGPLEETLALLVDHCVELTAADRGFLLVPEGDGFAVRVARGADRAALSTEGVAFAHSLAAAALAADEPLHAVVDEAGGLSPSADVLGLRAVICARLTGTDVPRGVIYLDAREANTFDQATLAFLGALVSQVETALRNATLYQRLLEDNSRLRTDALARAPEREGGLASLPWRYEGLIGRSPAMQATFQSLRALEGVASSVVIEGESGTGKELAARALHARSPRKDGPWVVLNCAAIPENLLESELFGHTRGAFTGAHADREGAFERAHGGTLFLDELGELPLEAQAKLLRVLQDGELRRLGATESRQVDVRIVAATNRDLRSMVAEKTFREDLYFRLAVFRVELPPLRERAGDLPLLAEAILSKVTARGIPAAGLSVGALAELSRRQWRG